MKFEAYKFETYMLRFLFGGCLLVCGLIMAAMVEAKPQPAQVASVNPVSTLLTAAPSTCAFTAADLVCLRVTG